MRPLVFLFAFATGLAQQSQNPSPMVEHTREHARLTEESLAGRREKLDIGTLYLPEGLPARPPLLLFFHGEPWIAETAAARNHFAVLSVVAGNGSGVYAKLFEDPRRFARLLDELSEKSGVHFSRVVIGGWSAGCGAVRQILKTPESYDRVDGVICIDGMHTDYEDGHPGPLESSLTTDNLHMWLHLAHDAIEGRKSFLLTHSEIFPGTYASTTETADYLLKELGVPRHALLKWGPRGMQQLSEASRGKFLLMGYAGNSAPDHVDQLHALPELLESLR